MNSSALKPVLAAASAAGLAAWAGRFKRAFPAVAFFGGFLWDAFTLGSRITSLDLFLLLGYLLGAAGILHLAGPEDGSPLRRHLREPTGQPRPPAEPPGPPAEAAAGASAGRAAGGGPCSRRARSWPCNSSSAACSAPWSSSTS